MRGKVQTCSIKGIYSGITPAYAGKSRSCRSCYCFVKDHPRLCGEKSADLQWKMALVGSPPPMRGKARCTKYPLRTARITPAYAGKSGDTEERYFAIGDHPRLCGEKYNNIWKEVIYLGSPPPMRGKVEEKPVKIEKTGITPAYAGKSFG